MLKATAAALPCRSPAAAAGPAHQFDRYYKDGAFDSCRKRLDELTFCLKLKAAGREQAKVSVERGAVWRRTEPLPPVPGGLTCSV